MHTRISGILVNIQKVSAIIVTIELEDFFP